MLISCGLSIHTDDGLTLIFIIDTYSMASGSKAAYMAYIAEGLGNLLDWDQAMAYQRKNGSFFDSPATTAAAAIHSYNGRAVDYLDLLITKSGSSSGVSMHMVVILICIRKIEISS